MFDRPTNTQHPFAHATEPRIDLYHGGLPRVVIQDSFTIMTQALPQLESGEHLLYLNTMASPTELARVTDKISARHSAKIMTFSAGGSKLIQKLEMLSHLVVVKKVKIIVLNSIELAVNGSRQKLALVQWLRQMRDGHDVRVVVYSVFEAGENGAMGLLRWLSDVYEEAGVWRFASPGQQKLDRPNANATIREIEQQMDAEFGNSKFKIENSKLGEEVLSVDELLAELALKNKEIEGVGARGEGNSKFKIKNSKLGEEEIEFAMAA